MSKFETRIQKKNHSAIMLAGLKIFSQFGFRGSTLDQIAAESGMSKPNILYYFQSKDAIYEALLAQLLTYAKHKIMMSHLYPRESRLYANEIIQGAPRIGGVLKGELREVVATLVEIINAWSDAGLIRAVNAHHLIFSIWATTQHYADFDVQIQAVLGKGDHFPDAEQYLEDMLRRILTV